MQLPKTYNPSAYEKTIYDLWEKAEVFKPAHRGNTQSYSIVVPPPNANGNLHIGHAMTLALEDIAVRYHRMKGEAALLLPGADHAGFETQVVYEKQLARAGKSRFDFSREELYQQIWDFVAKNRYNYENQFRALGASVDWDRFAFTLDEKVVKQAYRTFQKMWNEGLIYRGERLVNFCTFHGTAFADIEVEYQTENSSLWHIAYPLTDGSGAIVVATTRPETMLGDTAVAVHPKDERYTQYIGKTVKLPLTHREIPVIADDFVDKNFGTGAVKITPAHDPNDYEIGKRHDLPSVTVIDHQGAITPDAPEAYRGLSVDAARKQILDDLKKQGSLVKTEDHTHNVGHCYKCGTVIQPLLREQWFVDMQPLAKPAIKALKAKKITFYPDSKRQQLITYLEGLRDWNISRQIAWGIPIPAFQNIDNPDDWIFDERVDQATISKDGKTYIRDADVFDTWFSSSSWPYATLNFPDGEDYDQFYPLSLLETGGEILYPWVSRMIMLGLYVTGKIPFEAVYVHGYVLAEDGAKMSKSVGNVIDPTEVIETYGSDALRMGIISGRVAGVNRGYDQSKVEGARNFANKLWNIARYIEDKVGKGTTVEHPKPISSADHWILTKLQHLTEMMTADLDNYRFSDGYDRLYHFVWDDFADWYLEASKIAPNPSLLVYGLETMLKLTHPYAPFVTETIWQTLFPDSDHLLAVAAWPTVPAGNAKTSAEFTEIIDMVTEIRHIKSALNVRDVGLYYTNVPFLADNANLIKHLAQLEQVSQVRDGHGLHLTQTTYPAWLDIDQETARNYTKQLLVRKTAQEKLITGLQRRLDTKAYVRQAPKAVVEQTRQQLADAQQLLENITTEYERFNQAAADN